MAFVVQTAAFLALTGGSLFFCGAAHPALAPAVQALRLFELVYYRLD